MKAIETTITVNPDGSAVVRLPDNVPAGEHAAVVVIEDHASGTVPRQPLNLPSHDVGPWPGNLSLRREDLYGDDGR